MTTRVTFERSAFREFVEWATLNKKIHQRMVNLILDLLRQPYTGIGKPELLKYEMQGYWSRRIDDEHRLVYKVEGEMVVIVSCKYHYHKS
jgi:toxin YoeB